jgi:uncharacterized protein YabN with tetrapyrrole methylase and pyrophosphatase domain
LRGATAKFRDRFEAVERLAAARGTDLHDLDLAALDALWDRVKAQEGRTLPVPPSTADRPSPRT